MSEDTEIVHDFIVESAESLDELDRAFVALEANPADRDRIAAIFRTIHSIKGSSGFLGFSRLETLAHAGEEVLSLLRSGKLPLTPAITTELLGMVDAIRTMLRLIETTGGDGEESFPELVGRLRAIRESEARSRDAAKPEPKAAEPLGAATRAPGTASASPPAAKLVEAAAAPAPAAHPANRAEPSTAESEAVRTDAASAADATVRVDVGLLDKLMNLVGELVLARNQILQVGAAGKDAAFASASQRLNMITTELQEGVMKTRMRPIGGIWNKFPRVVRDLALACGKEVRLEMTGAETELDRTILEAIKDPLTHIVRNSVDHGIEPTAERVTLGKAPMGLLSLRAFHEGGKVNIEIADDGRGIDPERVRVKALEKGIVTQDRLKHMNEREIVNLVFAPGFSTAESVSNISGRGVGMDVVKTNIERIGGTVELSSRLGTSTTIKIKIPLTLAIIPALVVQLGSERYAIPQVNLLELVRLDGEQARASIERIHGSPVMRLRGNLLPLVSLREVLEAGEAASSSEAVNVVVVQADDRPFGLIVDGVSDTEEIVVKPLGRELKGVAAFAGATIMGDGRVALILDVVGVAQRAGVVSEVRERALALASKGTSLTSEKGSADALLLLEHGERGRVALPLALVARLEEFPASAVERAGGQPVVQYRGDILPLVTLGEAALVSSCAGEGGALQVVVFAEGERRVGLVVSRILDIVHDAVSVKSTGARPGIYGTAVIQGRVTELIDIRSALGARGQAFS